MPEPAKKRRRRRTISVTLDDETFAGIKDHRAAVPTVESDSAALRDLVKIAVRHLGYTPKD